MSDDESPQDERSDAAPGGEPRAPVEPPRDEPHAAEDGAPVVDDEPEAPPAPPHAPLAAMGIVVGTIVGLIIGAVAGYLFIGAGIGCAAGFIIGAAAQALRGPPLAPGHVLVEAGTARLAVRR